MEDRFSMSESRIALVFNLKFANIDFPKLHGAEIWSDTFHEQKKSFSSTRIYSLGNREAPRSEIIKK